MTINGSNSIAEATEQKRKLPERKLLPPLKEFIDTVGLKPIYQEYNGRRLEIAKAHDLWGVKDVWISGLLVGRIVWASWNRIYIFMDEEKDYEKFRLHHLPQFDSLVNDGLAILMADNLPDMIEMVDDLAIEYAQFIFSSKPLATILNRRRYEMYRMLSVTPAVVS